MKKASSSLRCGILLSCLGLAQVSWAIDCQEAFVNKYYPVRSCGEKHDSSLSLLDKFKAGKQDKKTNAIILVAKKLARGEKLIGGSKDFKIFSKFLAKLKNPDKENSELLRIMDGKLSSSVSAEVKDLTPHALANFLVALSESGEICPTSGKNTKGGVFITGHHLRKVIRNTVDGQTKLVKASAVAAATAASAPSAAASATEDLELAMALSLSANETSAQDAAELAGVLAQVAVFEAEEKYKSQNADLLGLGDVELGFSTPKIVVSVPAPAPVAVPVPASVVVAASVPAVAAVKSEIDSILDFFAAAPSVSAAGSSAVKPAVVTATAPAAQQAPAKPYNPFDEDLFDPFK